MVAKLLIPPRRRPRTRACVHPIVQQLDTQSHHCTRDVGDFLILTKTQSPHNEYLRHGAARDRGDPKWFNSSISCCTSRAARDCANDVETGSPAPLFVRPKTGSA